MPRTRIIVVGDRHDRLTVIEDRTEPNTTVRARCDCGTLVELHISNWDSTKSCGCLRDERTRGANTTHGGAGTPEHVSWMNMWDRCTRVKNRYFKDYGGRGITVCAEWRDFATFRADMGERPEGKSLDRIDVNGNYEPSNCRWATAAEQRANQRTPEQIRRDRATAGGAR